MTPFLGIRLKKPSPAQTGLLVLGADLASETLTLHARLRNSLETLALSTQIQLPLPAAPSREAPSSAKRPHPDTCARVPEAFASHSLSAPPMRLDPVRLAPLTLSAVSLHGEALSQFVQSSFAHLANLAHLAK